jgi:tetratricopeptide (TPR) repeat protein
MKTKEDIMNEMRKFTVLFFLLGIVLLTQEAVAASDGLQEWLIPLREAIYEQKLKADEIRPIYQAAVTASRGRSSGAALDLALARCEYFMGRAYQYEKKEKEAKEHYEEGMRLAEKALAAESSALGWLLRAENLSQRCALSLSSLTYVMANGLDVEKFAKNALALNSRNAAAQYIVAARWVFAPAAFRDLKKGLDMMMAIPENSDMEKDDIFNVYSAIGYAYIQQKKNNEARPWLVKALEIYPTNKYVAELKAKL